MLPARDFCLIRHGETDANRDGLIAGRTEAQLTPAGVAAANRLASLPWPEAITVFSSPQDRARITAQLAFPGVQVQVVSDLRERDWGRFERRPVSELPPRMSTPDGGEGWDPLLARIAAALRHCLTQAGHGLPIIVAHSGVIRAARALTGGEITGPSAPNVLPLMFRAPRPGGEGRWREHPFFTKDRLS